MTAADAQRRATRPQHFFGWTKLTFDRPEYEAGRDRIARQLKASGVVLLVPSSEGRSTGGTFRQLDDFLYFTGLELPRSILAIDAKTSQVILFAPTSDRRFANPARRNDFPGRRLAGDEEIPKRSGIADVRPFSEFAKALASWADDGRTIVINRGRGGALPTPGAALWERRDEVAALHAHLVQTHPKLAIQNGFAGVAAVRMIKSPAEIEVLRRASRITSRAIRKAASKIRPGVDERSLEGLLEAEFKAGGAQRPAFASIIKSGPNSLWPWRILAAHYDRRNRAMVAGDLVIFDVGCELDHYATDVGRTFPVSGEFTKRQRELVRMATRVSDAIIAAVRPGTTLGALQQVAYAAIPKAERRYMQTGLFFGHHVGLAVGDPSHPGARLAPGMVFTVEPWYYNHHEQIAVFVEDMVLVTKDGAENLTAGLPRDSKALAAMVGKRQP